MSMLDFGGLTLTAKALEHAMREGAMACQATDEPTMFISYDTAAQFDRVLDPVHLAAKSVPCPECGKMLDADALPARRGIDRIAFRFGKFNVAAKAWMPDGEIVFVNEASLPLESLD